MTNAGPAVFAAIVTCGAGAVLTLLTARRRMLAGWLAFLFTALSTVFIAAAAVQVLAGWSRWPAARWLAAGAAALRLQVDGLSTVFLMVAAVVALPASLYSIRYLSRYPGSVARYYPYFLLLLAAIFGLLTTADTLWWFLIFWQLMVFAGYILIRFDRAAGAGGANRFAIMLELACAAIVAGTGLLAHGGTAGGRPGYDWYTLSAGLPQMLSTAPGDSTLAFLLLFLGFAITMGLWPFGQFWLAHASPDAPAPVSALLSSVVIKIGAYGLMRYFLFLVPAGAQAGFPLAKWGMAIALLGTITLFVGTMQALASKRLLAFHSIGQMGYIALALGTCLALLPARNGTPAVLASFALLAALFHIVNHSLFGSLLYLNSGSVLQATGTKDLDRLGGLMKFMPITALTALVGSLAISGVPLLNGFASKWAIFVAAIEGAHSARYLAICALVAILTSGLTLASFIKFFGAIFLSRTSALVAEKALHGARSSRLEVGWTMQLPQLLLAFLCVLLGVIPGLAFGLLQGAVAATPQGLGTVLSKFTPLTGGALNGLSGPNAASGLVPLALLAVLGLSFLIAYGISKLGSAPRRAAAPWLCGYAPEADCQRYTAHNFYGEIKRYFHWLGGTDDGRAVTVKGRAS